MCGELKCEYFYFLLQYTTWYESLTFWQKVTIPFKTECKSSFTYFYYYKYKPN